MLTPLEKLIVDITVLSMMLLLSLAIYTSMPSHVRLMVQRSYFYIGGRVETVAHNVGLHKSHLAAAKSGIADAAESLSGFSDTAAGTTEL